jgi:hypothetical protein
MNAFLAALVAALATLVLPLGGGSPNTGARASSGQTRALLAPADDPAPTPTPTPTPPPPSANDGQGGGPP